MWWRGDTMSKYVMSDIHGCYDKFIEMLEKIQFALSDELYILGDIFDRGEKPLEILDYVLSHDNIHLIKGNHEDMLQESFVNSDVKLWYRTIEPRTYKEMVNRGNKFQQELYEYISKLPLYKIVENNILVHAGILLPQNYKELRVDEIMDLQLPETLLWTRGTIDNEKEIEGYNIICGHTPTQSIVANSEDAKILTRNGTYYIDCGCVFKGTKGKLACLRLEDKKEFYV